MPAHFTPRLADPTAQQRVASLGMILLENAMAEPVSTIIHPTDNGRRMSFEEFQRADTADSRRYELARGVIEVTDIPGRAHAMVLFQVEMQLAAWHADHAGVISFMGGGAAAKLELPALASERHPDLSTYLTPMPDDEYPWDKWQAAIVVEVVSPGPDARRRDYETKREEYLAAGVTEYWIVDPQERAMTALTRHGDRWREQRLRREGRWQTPLLPGFVLDLGRTFASA